MKRTLLLFVLTTGIVTVGNALAFAVQLIFARALPPDAYGALNAVFGLSTTLASPFTALPFVITQLTAEAGPEARHVAGVARRIFVVTLGLVAALCVLCFLLAPWTLVGLSVPFYVAALALPLIVASTILSFLPIGFAQYQRRYVAMSFAVAGVPSFRFFAGVLFVLVLGLGIDGGYAGLAAGGLLVFVVGSLFQRRLLLHKGAIWPPTIRWKEVASLTVPAILSVFFITALTFIDLPIVRSFATPHESGLYSAASMLAKIPLLLSNILINLVFPEVIQLTKTGGASNRASLKLIGSALAFTLATSGGVTLIMIVFASPLIVLTAGPAYADAAGLLGIVAVSMTLLAATSLLVTYAIARRDYFIVLPVALDLAAVLVVPHVFSLDVTQFAWLLLGAISFTLLVALGWLFASHRISPVTDGV